MKGTNLQLNMGKFDIPAFIEEKKSCFSVDRRAAFQTVYGSQVH